jgi:hypothetical protein
MLARSGAILVALGVAVVLALWWGRPVLVMAQGHLPTFGILLAGLNAVITHLCRTRWTQIYTEGWLATLPVSPRQLRLMVGIRSCWRSLAILAGLAITSTVATHGSGLVLTSTLGTLSGMVAGWWLPRREAGTAPLLARQGRLTRPTGVTLRGLSQWPLLQVKAWLRPRSLAPLMMLALGLPMDVPGNVAIALVWLLMTAVYLICLLLATVQVAKEASLWLRTTPLSFGRFAWALSRHAILKQLQWTLLGAVVLSALGVQPLNSLRIVEVWLAVCSTTASLGLACAHQSRSMGLKMLLSVGLLAMVESVRQYMALPCALMLSGWQLHRATRHE